jgi:import inner membrane translocase subunit TIM16
LTSTHDGKKYFLESILTILQAHKLIAQVILVGSQVVGRAFVQAYRQAAANSAAAAANGGSKAATTGMSGSNLLTKQLGIDLDEACKILNVKKESLVIEEINKVLQFLPSSNGSVMIISLSRTIRRKGGVHICKPKCSEPRSG